MLTKEILSIIALAALGLCLICGLAKMAMKSVKAKKGCDDACSLLVFIAVVLLGVSQLPGEEKFSLTGSGCSSGLSGKAFEDCKKTGNAIDLGRNNGKFCCGTMSAVGSGCSSGLSGKAFEDCKKTGNAIDLGRNNGKFCCH